MSSSVFERAEITFQNTATPSMAYLEELRAVASKSCMTVAKTAKKKRSSCLFGDRNGQNSRSRKADVQKKVLASVWRSTRQNSSFQKVDLQKKIFDFPKCSGPLKQYVFNYATGCHKVKF